MSLRPFHLAIPVDDLNAARHFYGTVLACRIGRESSRWIDFDFFGHQLTVHLKAHKSEDQALNEVDQRQVPVPHFGVILDWEPWQQLAESLQQHEVDWVIEPRVRFQGQVGEQGTLFIRDPAGNALEFKAFQDDAQIFAH